MSSFILPPSSLPYGSTHLDFDPSPLEVKAILRAKEMPALPDPQQAIAEALRKAIASPPLAEVAKPGQRVTIVTSDVTRVTGSEVYLPVLVEELNRAGVADDLITILIGTGAHRRQTTEEQWRLVTPELWGRVQVMDHDSRDPQMLVDLGVSARGTPIVLNRAVVETDLLILTGSITHHYHSGFTAGRKAVMPGVAAYDSVQANHSRLLNPEPGSGVNPNCRAGNLDGNPIHEEMLEAARKVNPAFLFNTVVNDQREIAAVFAGHWIEAHLAGCEFVNRHRRIPLPDGLADLVITSAGGYPKDIEFYQAHKAVEFASYAVRDGGVIIAAVECREGLGPHEFRSHFELGSVEAIEAQLRYRYRVPGGTAMAMLRKARRAHIILVTSLPEDDVRLMRCEPAPDLDTAIAMAVEHLGGRPSTYVLPEGNVTVPAPPSGH